MKGKAFEIVGSLGNFAFYSPFLEEIFDARSSFRLVIGEQTKKGRGKLLPFAFITLEKWILDASKSLDKR